MLCSSYPSVRYTLFSRSFTQVWDIHFAMWDILYAMFKVYHPSVRCTLYSRSFKYAFGGCSTSISFMALKLNWQMGILGKRREVNLFHGQVRSDFEEGKRQRGQFVLSAPKRGLFETDFLKSGSCDFKEERRCGVNLFHGNGPKRVICMRRCLRLISQNCKFWS